MLSCQMLSHILSSTVSSFSLPVVLLVGLVGMGLWTDRVHPLSPSRAMPTF